MSEWTQTTCIAFNGSSRIAEGELKEVALAAKEVLDRDHEASLLIFDDTTSALVEIDFRGTHEDVLSRLVARSLDANNSIPTSIEGPQGPGRPKLGVVAREVTLLPRHWDWLNMQPGGASVALRKLVEDARKANGDKDKARQSQEACYKFMSAMAGDLAGFEEASRALFAGSRDGFTAHSETWPVDIREHAIKLAGPAFG